ncbi:hypothetical protein EJ04DRAFT_520048 [Polyplosphaeria fusca]|uniref:Uncharacterized protein n=1 Tax=Polyplosphaeria fusca TaxID=682080 RepID=A0A9P4R8D0_9PLEO|nr:hypothetical protein EJ04DRAFT_520048 [Polyplosphaeria fusca]
MASRSSTLRTGRYGRRSLDSIHSSRSRMEMRMTCMRQYDGRRAAFSSVCQMWPAARALTVRRWLEDSAFNMHAQHATRQHGADGECQGGARSERRSVLLVLTTSRRGRVLRGQRGGCGGVERWRRAALGSGSLSKICRSLPATAVIAEDARRDGQRPLEARAADIADRPCHPKAAQAISRGRPIRGNERIRPSSVATCVEARNLRTAHSTQHTEPAASLAERTHILDGRASTVADSSVGAACFMADALREGAPGIETGPRPPPRSPSATPREAGTSLPRCSSRPALSAITLR